MKDKIFNSVIFILALPLISFHYLIDIYEEVICLSGNHKDKLFMKRMNLIDSKHIDDFIKWNNDYIEGRKQNENKNNWAWSLG